MNLPPWFCTFAKFIRTIRLIDYLNNNLQNTETIFSSISLKLKISIENLMGFHFISLGFTRAHWTTYRHQERKYCASNRSKAKNSSLESLLRTKVLNCSKFIESEDPFWYTTCILFIAPRESYQVCTAQGNCRVTAMRRTMQNEMVVNIFRRMIPLSSA